MRVEEVVVVVEQNTHSGNGRNGTAGIVQRPADPARTIWLPKCPEPMVRTNKVLQGRFGFYHQEVEIVGH